MISLQRIFYSQSDFQKQFLIAHLFHVAKRQKNSIFITDIFVIFVFSFYFCVGDGDHLPKTSLTTQKTNAMSQNQANVVITRSPKSQGIGIVLTLMFGSLGLFYSSIIGAIIMIAVEVATPSSPSGSG